MTPAQTKNLLERRAREIRARLAEIGGMTTADITDEIDLELRELRKEHTLNEAQQTALDMAGDVAPTPTVTDTAEGGEFAGLIAGSSIGEIYAAALEHRQTQGRTAELQRHYKLAPNQIPLDLLRGQPLETRAAATITGDVEGDQHPVIPLVYAESVSGFLSLAQPSVPVGQALFPVLSTGATVNTPDKSAASAETTGAFTVTTISPSRVQAAFRYTREDAAMFPQLDDSLRRDLDDAMMDKLDDLNINDTVNGLLGTSGLTNPTNPTTEASFSDYIDLVYGSVDGKYAGMASDVRLAMAVAAYKHAGSRYRNNSVDRTALDRIGEIAGAVRTTPHIADASGNDDTVIARKGMRMDYVNPIWQGVTVIPDEVTAAANGEIIITAVLMSGRALLRSDGFARYEVQTA